MDKKSDGVRTSLFTFWWLVKLCFRIVPLISAMYIVSSVIQTVLSIFGYYASARVTILLFTHISGSDNTSDIWLWFSFVIGSALISNICYRWNLILQRGLYFSLTKWSSLEFARHLVRIDLKDFYNPETKNMINRLQQGITWQLPNAAYFSLAICQSIINTLATTITIGFAVWWLVPLFILLLIPMLLHESRMNNIGWFVFRTEGDSQHIFYGIMSQFQDVRKQFEIRALNATKRLLGMLDKLTSRFYVSQMREVKKLNKLSSLAVVTQFLREAIAQGWLILQVITRQMTVDSYLFYVSMVFRLDGAISGLFSTMAEMQQGAKFSEDFRRLSEMPAVMLDPPDAMQLKSEPPSIEFIDASFRYPNNKQYVFKNISFKINPGQKIALVGENGAGKSTIVKLLLRFYKLDNGRIEINGIDINDIAIESLTSQLAVLFQDYNQYTLSARDNIAISDESPDESRVHHAARLGGAHHFIEELPQKYDSYLNPSIINGVELSGGQWQKVALARAFYRKANLLILDEPTSSIDAQAEAKIFNNIFEQHDKKTALIISHRFSTVRKADIIIVLKKGKIIENGNHDELIKKKGLYADMFNKQAEGYK